MICFSMLAGMVKIEKFNYFEILIKKMNLYLVLFGVIRKIFYNYSTFNVQIQ